MGVSSSRSKNQLVLVSIIIFALKCGNQIHAQDDNFEINNDMNEELDTLQDIEVQSEPNDLLENRKINEISSVLAKLLLVPWPEGVTPLVYIEKPDSTSEDHTNKDFDGTTLNENENEETMRPMSSKRSKYYRKYPYKRQHNARYEPSYMCAPKKDDVFRLLVALHGERNGKRGQLVDFCNRKRPASLVFTNIRFVG